MRSILVAATLLGACIILASGCAEPQRLEKTPVPEPVMDFHKLFAENCAGCHGENGMKGPAPRLNDPVYLAVADREDIYNTIKNGRKGTPMPAMAEDQGGTLTENQIKAIVDGMEREWSRNVDFQGAPVPAYRVEKAPPGDAQRGEAAYQKNCMVCHGFGKVKGVVAGPILDPHFLALISDQGLRTTMIVGYPDWGMPDWRHRIPDHPTTDQEISDIVAWLASERPQYAGETTQ
ncbi:MAG: c-type cytochrome [Bryobacteraceae bacterium]